MPVFYRQDGVSKSPGNNLQVETDIPKITTQWELDRLQSELLRAKSIEEKKAIREQILSIKRELNRTKTYTELSRTNALAREKSNDGKDSLDSLSASNLMRIDKDETWKNKEKRGTLLSKFFLYARKTDAEGNIHEEPYNGKDLAREEELYVDFGKNKSAYNRIWLGHMLSADVGYVKVGGKIWVRSIVQNRVGYYTKPSADGYIPVFSGDIVTIPTASEISEFVNGKEAQGLKRNSDQWESDTANDIYIERISRIPNNRWIELNTLTRESYDFWKWKWFTHEQACWIVANEFRESSANPRNTNGIAVGIFQWEKERKEDLERKYGKKILEMSHQEQLELAWGEMNTTEQKILEPLRNSKTIREAAAVFCEVFERPKDVEWEKGIRWDLGEIFSAQLEWKWDSPISVMWWNREDIERNLEKTSFLWIPINLHRSIVPALKSAENTIKQDPALSGYKIHRAEGYNWRNIEGTTTLSNHALWIALDLNPQENMWSFGNGQRDIPERFVQIMKENGFIWWGDWKTRFDPMHFEFSNVVLLAKAIHSSNSQA